MTTISVDWTSYAESQQDVVTQSPVVLTKDVVLISIPLAGMFAGNGAVSLQAFGFSRNLTFYFKANNSSESNKMAAKVVIVGGQNGVSISESFFIDNTVPVIDQLYYTTTQVFSTIDSITLYNTALHSEAYNFVGTISVGLGLLGYIGGIDTYSSRSPACLQSSIAIKCNSSLLQYTMYYALDLARGTLFDNLLPNKAVYDLPVLTGAQNITQLVQTPTNYYALFAKVTTVDSNEGKLANMSMQFMVL